MSDPIYVDRDNIRRRMGDVSALAREIESALGHMPPAADGGAVSALIGFIAAAGSEAANEYAGAVQLIGAITDDVMRDNEATESEMTAELTQLEQELDN